jgi:hypothetical protein
MGLKGFKGVILTTKKRRDTKEKIVKKIETVATEQSIFDVF